MNIATLDAQWGQNWLRPAPLPDDLAADVRKAFGGDLPTWAQLIAPVPWTIRAMLGGVDKKISHMPVELWDLVSFVVSQDNACRYCYGTTRAVLRVLGYSEAVIDKLEGDVDLDAVPAAEQVALRFARKLSRFHPKPGAKDLAELEAAGFSREAVAEIVFVASFAGFGNRVATFFSIQPEAFENMMQKPLVRLIRPWLARQFRGRHVPAAPLPAPNEPPFEELIAKLDGSPTAHAVRGAVDEGLRSPVLPRRTKLLMFAIIARTLDAPYVESQSRRALAAEGLAEPVIDRVLENLGGPELSAAESLLVPYARETVWYRNLEVQQRTRALAERLSVPEVIEAVGIASVANSVTRLSVLLEQ